jgi:arsenate reductase-like glutaredoxin family protein
MEVQIFGIQKNQDVRKALRFFSERRVLVHFVNLRERAASRGELHRFAQKLGVGALIDRNSKRYSELGLGTARYDDAHWLGLLADEPLVLAMPLARFEHKVTVGLATSEWESWVTRGKR